MGSDRLLAEQQPSIAAAMGFADEPGLPAVDGLMRSVFEQARQVEHVTASVFDTVPARHLASGTARRHPRGDPLARSRRARATGT